MTISVSEALLSGPYNGDGVTTSFDYDFKIYAESELSVLRQNADGTANALTLTTDYTVGGVGDAGGGAIELTNGSVLPIGSSITIEPDISMSQDRPFSTQSSTTLAQIELALDKLTSLVRQVLGYTNRSLKVGPADGPLNDLSADRNKLIGFDGAGQLTTYGFNVGNTYDGSIEYASVATLKISNEAARGDGVIWRAEAFRYREDSSATGSGYITNAAGVKLVPLALFGGDFGGVYCPEMLGETNTAIRDMFKAMPAGSKLWLRGQEYETVAITINNDPLASDGADTGKVIEGASVAQRYETTGSLYGTRIKLADGEDADVFRFESDGANTFAAGGLRNLLINGNKSNQTAGSGIYIDDVKDIELHNIYVWNCKEDGINFNGANNQINMTGFIEVWNNDRDGIRGGAIGDAQITASIRCVNNGRHGFYLAAGGGRYSQIYSYFNTERGVWFGSAVDSHIFVDYMRSEDNDKEGVRIDADGVHIAFCECPDNGADSTVGTERTGLYLHSSCKNFVCDVLSTANRQNGVPHNQRQILYAVAGAEGHIGHINNRAFGQHSLTDEKGAVLTDNTELSAVSVGRRRKIKDTYANLKDTGNSITPEPAVFEAYEVSAISSSMTIIATAANQSCEGMELALALTSSGSYNVNWSSDYLDQDGVALSATALTSGQTVHATFRQQNGKWVATLPLTVA